MNRQIKSFNVFFIVVFFVGIATLDGDVQLSSRHQNMREKTVAYILQTCAEAYPQALLNEFIKNSAKATNRTNEFRMTRNIRDLGPFFKAFEKPHCALLDITGGDGRVVFYASLFNIHAFGIESDARLYNMCLRIKKKLVTEGAVDADKVSFIHGKPLEHSLASYDIVYAYFGSKKFTRYLKKFDTEMRSGSALIIRTMREGKTIILKNFQLKETLRDEMVRSRFWVYEKK